MLTKVALGLVVAGLAVTAAVHLRMTDSFPKAESEVTESPTELRVWFNQQPRLPVSRLGLEGPDGEVALGPAEQAEGMSFTSAIRDTLVPGAYTVSWRTAGDDGHVRRGSFTFTMTATEEGR